MVAVSKEIRSRLHNLENHLQNESPLLVDAVRGFKELDQVAYRLGLLNKNQSFATQIPWWPLIAVLGTDSVGKSNFLKTYLGDSMQEDESQDGDEKFTVYCYANGEESRVLPGIALDADPRFPFYQISDELERLAPGNGANVNNCLQLKTNSSDQLQGYTYVDVPSFSNGSQCVETLKLTDHIIEVSDLVLVFVDEQELESGHLRDKVKQLLSETVSGNYSNKFIYIVKPAKDESTTAWQEMIEKENMSSIKALPLEEKESKNSTEENLLAKSYSGDTQEITDRIQQIYIDRTYRILGNLDSTARNLQQRTLPKLRSLIRSWEKKVLWRDIIGILLITAAAFFSMQLPIVETWLKENNYDILYFLSAGAASFTLFLAFHHLMRSRALRSVITDLEEYGNDDNKPLLKQALIKNSRFLRSIFRPEVVGWKGKNRKRLQNVLNNADEAIQKLNDKYMRPSGN